MTRRVAQVLLESPVPRLDRLLDYWIPNELDDQVIVGGRVRVPLGKGGARRIDGYVIGIVEQSTAGVSLADIDSVLGEMPVLTPTLWQLVRTVADRNCGSAADVLRVAIPKRGVRAEKGRNIPARELAATRPSSRRAMALSSGVWETDLGPTTQGFHDIANLVGSVDGGVIVVVPDWRDLALLSRALGDTPHVVFDSSGTPSERYTRYLDVLAGDAKVVIGTRSAVYAPVVDLELLVVVDESDPLLEEPHTPYVHARDVAVIRNSVEGGALVFASVTPSVESARFIDMGFIEPSAEQPRRPHIILANDTPDEGFSSRARIPGSAWAIVRDALSRGPVLVQVSRPGFTPQVVCAACRTPHRCGQCRSLLSGNREGTVFCRACGLTPIGLVCAHCSGREISWSGNGSVRTAEELGRAFPGMPVLVADGEHRTLEIPRRQSLVISTRGAEPIVSGGYEAVMIVDGDRELQRPGLRTTENCLRWWGHAASLAATEAPVILANVEGGFASQFSTNQWESIVETELRERRALGFPPATRAIAVRGTVNDLQSVRNLDDVKRHRIMGPAPDGETFRIVILADYRSAPEAISAIRSHLVATSATGLRVHCDDLSIFDEVDND